MNYEQCRMSALNVATISKPPNELRTAYDLDIQMGTFSIRIFLQLDQLHKPTFSMLQLAQSSTLSAHKFSTK